ncbi:hypothetical protein J6590_105109, partial [Homalodisca vitripennis]
SAWSYPITCGALNLAISLDARVYVLTVKQLWASLYVENIDVLDAVKRLGVALNMEVANYMIDACHLVREKAGASGRTADKEESEKKLSSRHLNLPTNTPTYINKSLTSRKRRLLERARAVRSDRDHVLISKNDGEQVNVIKCQVSVKVVVGSSSKAKAKVNVSHNAHRINYTRLKEILVIIYWNEVSVQSDV